MYMKFRTHPTGGMEGETAGGSAQDDGREREDHLRGALQRPQKA